MIRRRPNDMDPDYWEGLLSEHNEAQREERLIRERYNEKP